MSKGPRQRAYRRGRSSEALCRLMLRVKGYRILASGFRVPAGEIDIVARRGGTLAIVEVKARASLADAAEALGARQRRRIARAASAFLQQYPAAVGLAVRFDVMLVRPWRLPRHMTNAWRLEDVAPPRRG
ncbi:MAG: YraN family protein [Alphaproteobacteria bacterium]